MRVHVTPVDVQLSPGVAETFTVTIANTQTIIAGYAIRVLGADPSWVQLATDTVSLFPDEVRAVEVTIDPPQGIPAGTRRIAVQVRELTDPHDTAVTEIDLTVPAEPMIELRVDPVAVTAGRRAGFGVLAENTGNTEIKAYLSGDDPERKVRFAFEPDRLVLLPGQHAVVDMRASARRRLLGNPVVRQLSVYLDPVADDAFFNPDATPALRLEGREPLASATFIQKPVVARAGISLVGLLFAATVFAVVITITLSRLVAQSAADRNLALQVAAARQAASTTGTSGVAGTVRLLTSGTAVPGVGVSVFTSADTTNPVATTATDGGGNFRVTDLAAGKYKIGFRGAGFVQLWYPNAATADDASEVELVADQVKGGLGVNLGGVPATISGTVVGDDVSAATLFLTTVGTKAIRGTGAPPAGAQPGSVSPPDNGGAVVQQVPVGSDGTFALSNVPSPSVYDLVVIKNGYAPSTQRINVAAGEARSNVRLTLVLGDGVITGTVSSQTGPLSEATITATSGQSSTSTVSLAAGTFTLRSLPTPATFTVTVTKAGYATQVITLGLSTGQRLTGVAVALARSSASLTGVVTAADGTGPLGGVAVSVSDGNLTVQTATQSAGDIGSWQVDGLPVPGSYTVTFARADLQSQTVSVALDSAGNITPGSVGTRVTADGLSVRMQSATAVVQGTVRQPGGGAVCDPATSALGEATVTISSGSSSFLVTTASVAPNCGRYRIETIPPGTYTLTVTTSSGTTPTSQVITVTAAQVLTADVTLARPASMSGTVRCCSAGSTADPGPRGGWTVFLYHASQYPIAVVATTTTDGTGAFSFDDIDADTYVVATGPTSDPSNAVATVRVTVQPSKARTGVVILVGQ